MQTQAQGKGQQQQQRRGGEGAGAEPSAQMILRIKRKRREEPVDALVIQQAERAKRRTSGVHARRSDVGLEGGVLAGLMEQSEGSGSGNGEKEPPETSRGVFRFAETVPITSFTDETAARQLRQRIAALTLLRRERPSAATALTSSASSDGSTSPSNLNLPSSAPALGDRTPERGAYAHAQPGTSVSLSLAAARARASASEMVMREKERASTASPGLGGRTKFRVINSAKSLRRYGSSGSLRGTPKKGAARAPPEIRSAKQMSAEALFGRIVDAVAESNSADHISSQRSAGAKTKSRNKPAETASPSKEVDSRFADMLSEYLKLSDVPAPSDLTSSISPALEHAPIAGGSSLSNNANADSDSDSDADSDDYVYDVYYRDVLPSRPRPADVGLEPAAVAGHAGAEAAGLDANPELSADRVQVVGGAPVNSEGDWPAGWNAAAGGVGGVVAQLEGLSDSEEELVDSGEEDEFDEGEDEDSNDENFYKNDYPDEGEPDDDGPGMHSSDEDDDEDDEEHYGDSDQSF